MYKAKYSGSGKCGICICGCPWDNHHLGVVMNEEYFNSTGESYIPQECETYGFNETGGMKQTGEEWKNHCHGYVDIGYP